MSVVSIRQAARTYPPLSRLSNPLFILTFESHCTYSSVGVLDNVLVPVSSSKLLDSGSRARGGIYGRSWTCLGNTHSRPIAFCHRRLWQA